MTMIKCPECGHDVSDKAPRCPHCGIEIAGKVNVEKPSNVDVEPTAQPEPPKKNNKNRYVIVSLIIVILILCGGGYYWYGNMKGNDKETTEYEFALTSNDTTVLSHYLETYQDAPEEHIDKIRQRMEELMKVDKEWTDAVVRGTKAALLKYMEDHPNSVHADEALHKIDSLDWETAKDANTVTAYQTYMHDRPNGEYFDEASEALRQLNTKTVQPEEELIIGQLFKTFYQSLNNKDEAALTATVSSLLTSFLGKNDATRADVLTFMNKIYKSDVSSMNWHTSGDYNIKKKEIGEEQYEYSVEFMAVQDVNHSDGSTVKNNYKVKAKVSPDGKITEYNMTRLLE